MTYQGIDTIARFNASGAKKLKAADVSFVGRYLGPPSWDKALTAAEVTALHGAGLAILLCWEQGAMDARGGAAAGAMAGENALRWAASLGVPAETVIYFAVDYNAPAADYPAITAYLAAAQRAVRPYRVGVYGPQGVVDAMHIRVPGVAAWQCIACSSGWSEFADVRQYAGQNAPAARAMSAKIGVAVDLCDCNDLQAAGLWLADYKHYEEDDGGVIIEPQPQPKPAPEPWYAEAMAWAAAAGLINDGRPRDNLTRAEMATILQRYDDRVDAKIAEALQIREPEDDKTASGLLTD